MKKNMTKLVAVFLAALMVLGCLAGITAFAADVEATWTDGTATAEGTLAEMGKQVNEKGGTITLMKDYADNREKGYIITSNKSFTLDLNGHKIETTAFIFSVTEKATGVTVIKNGTMVAQKQLGSIKGGGFQLLNVVGSTTEGQGMNYTVTESTWNKENLIDGCTLHSAAWGVLSFNNTTASQEAASVTVKNSTLVTSKDKSNTIAIQTKAIGANLVLGEGVKMYSNLTGDRNYANAKINVTGEPTTKATGKTVTVLDKTFEGMTEWSTSATPTVTLEIPTATAPATPAPSTPTTTEPEAAWTDGKNTVEGTLAELGKQADAKGGTIKLLRDVTITGQEKTFAFYSKKSVTFDLNGHTLTTEKGAIRIEKGADGVTTVKNGTIISGMRNVSVVTGAMHLENLTMWSKESQNIDYYEASDAFNHQNLIENCTIGNTIWGVVSFNSTTENQEKACITFKNSSIIAAKGKGNVAITLQNKPEGSTAQVALGEGVKIYSYGKSAIATAVAPLGEVLTKAEGEQSVTILDNTYDLMNLWTTPATATVDLSTVIPGPKPTTTPAEKPAETPATTTPSTSAPAETEKKEESKTPAASTATATFVDESEGAPMGLIIGIVAAVVVIAVVAVVVLKKKKQ